MTGKQHLQNLLIEIEADAAEAAKLPTQAARMKAYRQALYDASFWIKAALADIEAQEQGQRPAVAHLDPGTAREQMRILNGG